MLVTGRDAVQQTVDKVQVFANLSREPSCGEITCPACPCRCLSLPLPWRASPGVATAALKEKPRGGLRFEQYEQFFLLVRFPACHGLACWQMESLFLSRFPVTRFARLS